MFSRRLQHQSLTPNIPCPGSGYPSPWPPRCCRRRSTQRGLIRPPAHWGQRCGQGVVSAAAWTIGSAEKPTFGLVSTMVCSWPIAPVDRRRLNDRNREVHGHFVGPTTERGTFLVKLRNAVRSHPTLSLRSAKTLAGSVPDEDSPTLYLIGH